MAEQPIRERWSSRTAFIFAAVGSTIGLGNVWRFPALCLQYGGGAFFIPYLLALVFVGIPVLLLEIALGQFYQSGNAICFGQMHKRLRGVGLGSLWCGFMVVCYYNALLGWAVRMFFYFDAPWNAEGADGGAAWGWFVSDITGLQTVGDEPNNNELHPTGLVGVNVACLAFVWLCVFGSLALGVKSTGRLTYVTVTLPVVLLLMILIRVATLPGSKRGVKAYIGTWDMKDLGDQPEMWSTAVTQIFFSLSVTFGIMTAYASYNKRDQPAAVDTVVIAVSNSLFSFIAGFVVFASLGYWAHSEGMQSWEPCCIVPTLGERPSIAVTTGRMFAFNTLPVTLSELPGGDYWVMPGGEFWVRIFFLMVFFLGLNSAFSLIEGVVTAMRDTMGICRRTPRFILVGAVCTVGFVLGLLYCSDAGLLFLDVVDFYISFVMLFVGFFETASAGWVYGFEGQVRRLGSLTPPLVLAFSTFGTIIAACAVGFGGQGGGWAFFTWITCHCIGILLAISALPTKDSASIRELMVGNIEELREKLTAVVGPIPLVWSVLIKHVLPSILVVLIANLASTKSRRQEEYDDYDRQPGDKSVFGDYEEYSTLYQFLGITISLFCLALVAFGVLLPDVLAPLAPLKEEAEAEAEAEGAAEKSQESNVVAATVVAATNVVAM